MLVVRALSACVDGIHRVERVLVTVYKLDLNFILELVSAD